VVDLDPQGHLTAALKLALAVPPVTLAAALTGEYTGDMAALVAVYPHSAIGVIPNALEMFTVGRELDQLRARETRLARVLEPLRDLFDAILLDCPPALDILTDNALTAADGVLIPVQAEDSSLHALRLLLAQIAALEKDLRRDNPLVMHGLVVSMLERGSGGQAKSRIGRSVLEEFAKLPLPVLATVPRGVPVTEAWRLGQTVAEYAPESEHAAAYALLAKAIDL
jgi:chromosome partitioning protein